MVRIRLKKTGAKNWGSYRIVVSDIRSSRDGYCIDTIGFYDPKLSNEKIDVEKAESWIAKGAQPSRVVVDILKRAKAGKGHTMQEFLEVKKAKAASNPKKTKKVKAAPAAEAPAAEAAAEAPAQA